MTSRRWISLLVFTLGVLGLAGCDTEGRVVQENSAAIAKASSEIDTEKAIQELEAQLEKSDLDRSGVCDFPAVCGESLQASRRDLYKAMSGRIESSPSTLTTEQLLRYVRDIHLGATREVIASQIVTRARAASGTREDVRLLETAGMLLANGELVLRSATGAIELLNRSWLAGSTKAAKELANLHSDLGNFDTAYLWSVRNKTPGWAGIQRIKNLSPEGIQKAEAAAVTKTILFVR